MRLAVGRDPRNVRIGVRTLQFVYDVHPRSLHCRSVACKRDSSNSNWYNTLNQRNPNASGKTLVLEMAIGVFLILNLEAIGEEMSYIMS